jgi:hypothetical protein
MLVNIKIVIYKKRQSIAGVRTIAAGAALYNTVRRGAQVLYTGWDAARVLELR